MRISVIIPIKNGESTLGKCLQSIRNQTIKDIEIIVLDSRSSDSSVAIAKSFDCTIIDIEPSSFNHGLTRNIGVKAANAAILYLTVQDAYLAHEMMFENMLNHFTDMNVMAVTGHQAVPHDKDKNPVFWFKRISEPVVEVKQFLNVDAFKNLSPSEKVAKLGWDNVVAMYRKDALIELPFIKTAYAEDAYWCYEALLKGWKLLYDSSIVTYHYHHKTFSYSYRVTWALQYHFYSFFKYKPSVPPFFTIMAKRTYQLLRNQELTFSGKLYWIFYNLTSEMGNWMAVLNFLWKLKFFGKQAIEKSYLKYCKEIPQGMQNIDL